MEAINKIGSKINDAGINFFQGRPSSSGPVQIPNLYTPEQGQAFGDKAASIASSPLPPEVIAALLKSLSSPVTAPASEPNTFLSQLGSEINSAPTATSQAEKDLVANLTSQASGRFNALGIGDSGSAATGVAAAAAPALVDLKRARLASILSGGQLTETARSNKANESLKANELNLANLANVFTAFLKNSGLSLDTFLKLASLGTPQFGTSQSGGLQSGAAGFQQFGAGTKDFIDAGATVKSLIR